ncbi:MAG: hypothetical protein IKN71_07485 [Alphaproteobacteria bacterium]|nr:hypothetical protein [Alphaproteobacteria bacterium]
MIYVLYSKAQVILLANSSQEFIDDIYGIYAVLLLLIALYIASLAAIYFCQDRKIKLIT